MKDALIASTVVMVGIVAGGFIGAMNYPVSYEPGENKAAVTLIENGRSVCSGTYIGDTNNNMGYILTAEHCYRSGGSYEIQFVGSKEKFPVFYSAFNQDMSLGDYDLALFRTNTNWSSNGVSVSDFESTNLYCGDVSVGEFVWMTGNPGLPPINLVDQYMLTSFGYMASDIVVSGGFVWAEGFEVFHLQAFGGYSGAGIMMQYGMSHVLTGAYGNGAITYSLGAPVTPLCGTMFENLD